MEEELVKELKDAVLIGDVVTAQNIVTHLASLNLKLDIDIENEESDQASRESQFNVTVQVEDRESSGAHFDLLVRPTDKIEDLKRKVWLKYKFPSKVQRWIVNKRMPDDKTSLRRCDIKEPTTLFLYILPAHSVGLRLEDKNACDKFGENYLESDENLISQTSPGRSLFEVSSPMIASQSSDILMGDSLNIDATGCVAPNIVEKYKEEEEDEVEEGVKLESPEWQCDWCTFKNISSARQCELCFSNREADGVYGSWKKEEHVLAIGDRVVWLSDKGPEEGTVRWIGTLPDADGNETIVGVDFDNPVGSGTGKYKNHRLFDTKQGHAALLPPIGLFKKSNFNFKQVT